MFTGQFATLIIIVVRHIINRSPSCDVQQYKKVNKFVNSSFGNCFKFVMLGDYNYSVIDRVNTSFGYKTISENFLVSILNVDAVQLRLDNTRDYAMLDLGPCI